MSEGLRPGWRRQRPRHLPVPDRSVASRQEASTSLACRSTRPAPNVYIQASIRNLVATFGNSFGAQLLDLYVRDPSATDTSTAAAYPQLNYSIAPADAWSERLEAQGFAPAIWVDASGTALASCSRWSTTASGTITLIVPQSVFGTAGSGWVFTLALTGQNGFNSYQARDFTATPRRLHVRSVRPRRYEPDLLGQPEHGPDVMDTITPPSSQATELDPTLGPVCAPRGRAQGFRSSSRSTRVAPSRAIRERGTTWSNPACSAWVPHIDLDVRVEGQRGRVLSRDRAELLEPLGGVGGEVDDQHVRAGQLAPDRVRVGDEHRLVASGRRARPARWSRTADRG